MRTPVGERNGRRSVARGFRALALLALALLVTAACQNTPDPLPEAITFSGELARDGTVAHNLTLAESGLVEVVLASLDLRDVATGEITQPTGALRFGLGRPDTDPDDEDGSQDEGETEDDFCDETFLAGVIEGSNQVFRLQRRDYCISLTDLAPADDSPNPGTIPLGKVALYSFTLTSTD
jgi:hypothetical protein